MRILLIMPDANIHRLTVGPLRMSFREAPLTLTTLASLVPPHLNATVRIVDESVGTPVPTNGRFDLVGISCLTGTATRAYALADSFRARGIPVVLGGVHVTLRPDEAARHADAVVTGFAERTWPRLLDDLAAGSLQPRYHDPNAHPGPLPPPRRDLQKRFGYMSPNTVMATRGCKGACDFCSVPPAGYGWHTRPVGEVIDEIRHIPSRRFVFNDVSLLEDREYARELFTALAPLRKKWGGLCTTRIGRDDELLELMARSGCIYLLLGFESVANSALYGIRKGFNKAESYPVLMDKLHRADITVQGCFIFGFDHDTTRVFRDTVDAVQQLRIDIPRYAVYTPYPGTPLYERLRAEDRLLHEEWQFYDTQHVVFRPARMSPEQLDSGFRWAWRRTFTVRSIAQRTLRHTKYLPITFLGNLAYRLYIHRMANEAPYLAPACADAPVPRCILRSNARAGYSPETGACTTRSTWCSGHGT